MKRTAVIIVMASAMLGMIFSGCNTPEDPAGAGEAVMLELNDGGLYRLENSDQYPGAEVNLLSFLQSGQFIADISQYSAVIVDAALYSDTEGAAVAVKTNPGDNLAQFKLLKGSGGWDDDANVCAVKYNMAADGATSMTGLGTASGVPSVLLLQANWNEFPQAVRSIRVRSITFTVKSGNENDVVLDWGTGYTTDLFPVDKGEWPGRSIALDDPEITVTGILGDISLYSEVIVDAAVLDRNGNPFTAEAITDGNPFFTLVANNDDWVNSALVKKYDMNRDGETSASEDTADLWKTSGVPAHIVFQGKYDGASPNDRMAGYVTIRKITFTAK